MNDAGEKLHGRVERKVCNKDGCFREREREVDLSISSLVERSAKSLIYIAVTHINWLYSCRAFSAQLSSFDVFCSRPAISSRRISMSSASFSLSSLRFPFFIIIDLFAFMEIAFQTSKVSPFFFYHKLIFNSFSPFRLRAGFDAGVMKHFFPLSLSSFQMLNLTAQKEKCIYI